MVARWLQAKQAKIKKGRRAWARKFSMKSTGIVANPLYINDTNEPVSMSFGARNKVAKTQIPEHVDAKFRDHNKLNQLPTMISRSPLATEEIMFTRIQDFLGLLKNNNPRTVILKRTIQSQLNAGSIQGIATFACQTLLDGKYEKLYLYMSGEWNFFVSKKYNQSQETGKASINYNTRQRAMDAFCDGRITWVYNQTYALSSA